MRRDFIKDLLGVTDTEVDNFIESLTKIVNEFGIEVKDRGDDNENGEEKSYLRMKGSRYDDGKLVEKYDKEYVNGECTKNEEFNAEKCVENKTSDEECKCGGKCKCHDKSTDAEESLMTVKQRMNLMMQENSDLEAENNSLRSQIDEMRHYIDGLNDQLKTLTFENGELKKVIDNIKKCF